MKTLSIQQPWATLICSGIKDVENRTWKASKVPGKILIHASSKKVSGNFLDELPLDWMIAMKQEMLYGNIPEFSEMPTSAIIGYATVTGFEETTDSIWDGGEGIIKWTLKDMYMFDEPIEGVSGKLHLFDYPIDEDNLPPAHKVKLTYPELLCGVLNIPVAKDVFENAYKTHELTIDIDPTLAEIVSEKDGSLKKIQSAVLECGDICMPVEIEEMRVLDYINTETGEPIVEQSIFGEEVPWQSLVIRFK